MTGPHQLELVATVSDELLDGDALDGREAGQHLWYAPETLRAQARICCARAEWLAKLRGCGSPARSIWLNRRKPSP